MGPRIDLRMGALKDGVLPGVLRIRNSAGGLGPGSSRGSWSPWPRLICREYPMSRADLLAAPVEVRVCQIGTSLGVQTDPMPVGPGRMGNTEQAPSAVQKVPTRQEGHCSLGGLSQGHHERVGRHRHPGPQTGAHQRLQHRMPDERRARSAVVAAVHEAWIVDGGDATSKVVHVVEELGGRFDTEGGGEPNPVEHRDQVDPHRAGERPHGVGTPECSSGDRPFARERRASASASVAGCRPGVIPTSITLAEVLNQSQGA